MVREEEGIAKGLVFGELLGTWEYPLERKRGVLIK
jgi:hypothetical protein